MMKLFDNKGQTILETIIALTVILLILASISVAIITALNNSTFEKNQNLAGKFAKEGIEYVRYLRNTNASDFHNRDGVYCLSKNTEGSPVFTPTCITTQVNVDNQFIRIVTFEKPPTPTDCVGDETHVTVEVLFSSARCPSTNRFCHKSELVSCFIDPLNSTTL